MNLDLHKQQQNLQDFHLDEQQRHILMLRLIRKVEDQFEDTGMGAVFTFLRVDDKVFKVKIEVQGMEMLAERIAEEKK